LDVCVRQGAVDSFVRYYDPVAGRFLSTDPVVTDNNSGASFSRYTYANNNPYRYIDPDGRDAVERFVEAHRTAMETGKGKDDYQAMGPVAVGITGVMIVVPAVVLGGPTVVAAAKEFVKAIPVDKLKATASILMELNRLKGVNPNMAKLTENTVKQAVQKVSDVAKSSKKPPAGSDPKVPPPPPPPPPPKLPPTT
jgi:RHS repeat-associated protein